MSAAEGNAARAAPPQRPHASQGASARRRGPFRATNRRTQRPASRNRPARGRSPADDYFAQLVAREEEFQGLETAEQLLQAPVVENLLRLAGAAIGHEQRLRILYAERVLRRRLGLLLRLKYGEQIASGLCDAEQPFDGRGQQRRAQMLENVP